MHYYGEQAVDRVALKLLETQPDWGGETGKIILDIDEDYFGVELPGQMLVDAGLNWDTVMMLQTPLNRLFCPKRIRHEASGNRMMRGLIDLILKRCRKSGSSESESCLAPIGELRPIVLNFLLSYQKIDATMFCSTNIDHVRANADELTNCLMQFGLNHLRVLKRFGFCLETTPATARFRDNGFGSFGVCTGLNPPNSTVVYLHKPDAAEIKTRTLQLRKMLRIIDERHRPNVVTLCRSVRDGYTPRSLFRSIEDKILDIFQRLPGRYDVTYDPNLYGGVRGWPVGRN